MRHNFSSAEKHKYSMIDPDRIEAYKEMTIHQDPIPNNYTNSVEKDIRHYTEGRYNYEGKRY